uniref:Peptidase S1 domain-containing protein n=1 Tax=Steinernema glaseri TaxID=37863 RepID=A0A1I7ZIU7_9BILA
MFFSDVKFQEDTYWKSDFVAHFKIVAHLSPEEQTHTLVLIYTVKVVKAFKDKYNFFTKGEKITIVVFNSPELQLDSEYIVSGWKKSYDPNDCQAVTKPSIWILLNGTSAECPSSLLK